jgi:hypothetical protein
MSFDAPDCSNAARFCWTAFGDTRRERVWGAHKVPDDERAETCSRVFEPGRGLERGRGAETRSTRLTEARKTRMYAVEK